MCMEIVIEMKTLSKFIQLTRSPVLKLQMSHELLFRERVELISGLEKSKQKSEMKKLARSIAWQ